MIRITIDTYYDWYVWSLLW